MKMIVSSDGSIEETVNDYLFVLDGSQDVTEKAFNEVKDAILRQLESYQISPDKTRIGFAVIGKEQQYSAPSGDSDAIHNALRRLKLGGGDRRLDQTLYFVGGRQSADFRKIENRIVVLFMHGSNAEEGKPKLAQAARILYGMKEII